PCPRCFDFVNYRLAQVWVQRLRSAEREAQAAAIVLIATTRSLVHSGVRPTLALSSHPRESELPRAARDVRRKRTDSVLCVVVIDREIDPHKSRAVLVVIGQLPRSRVR